MKVLRQRELEVKNIRVGDQIVIPLAELGEFTATAQKITDKGPLFLFDECIAKQPMNKKWTNKGGYEKSDLRKWINTTLLDAFPEELKNRMNNLTIPTYGQIFGHDDWYDRAIEPDSDEQFPLMVIRKNRIADFNNDYEWYWLANATREEVSASSFARVYHDGGTYYDGASISLGVRPAFVLVD